MIGRELIKKLRTLEIVTSRLADERLAGGYHSVFKGRGMTFREVRPYQIGDDVRFIDWNVSARMNDTYVKVFTEEREMTVMLLVDLSGSQRFGTQQVSKVNVAAEIAALLAFSAIRNHDRVGLILFTDRVELYVPPRRGRAHVMRVVTEILNAKPQGTQTNLTPPLEMLSALQHRRSIAFVLSDFMNSGYERALRIAAKKHDVIPVQIIDPREEVLTDVGWARMVDLEDGSVLEVDTSDARVRTEFAAKTAREREQREQSFRKLQLDFVTIRCGEDSIKPLAQLFRQRQRRMAGYR